jgi:hypothetical protein
LSLFLNVEENDENEGDDENDNHVIVIEGDEGILGGSSTTTDHDAPGEHILGPPSGGAPTAVKRGLTPFLKQLQIAIRQHKLLHRSRDAAAGEDCTNCQLTSTSDPQILANQAHRDKCLKFLDADSQSAENYCGKYWKAVQLKVSQGDAGRTGPRIPL